MSQSKNRVVRTSRIRGHIGCMMALGFGFVWLAGCHTSTAPSDTQETVPTKRPAFPEVAPGAPFFEDKTPGSGVDFTYRNGEGANYFTILDSLGGGAALIDFDQDGWLDLFIPGGGDYQAGIKDYEPQSMAEFNKEKEKNPTAKLPPAPRIFGYPGKLYRNLGNFRFQDVTGQVGLDHQPDVYTHGAAVADYDLDGYPDLLVTGYGRVTLWHNEPDGKGGRRFVDVTGKAGLLGPNPESRSLESNQPGDHFWSTSAAWGDLDGDGYPDLYLCQYVNWSFVKNHPPCNGYTVKVPHDVCPPKTFDSVPHALWRNRGDGTFENVTAAAGLRVRREDRDYGKGLGVLLVDVDGDLKPDIYVANDTTDNFLYLNRSKPAEMRFEDKSLAFGVARDHNGVPNGSMGVDAADFDGCGRPSIFVTNYESEYHALYRSVVINNRLSFTFSTPAAGLGVIGPNFVGFGTKFVDVDSDGWEDIVITNGHVVYYPPRDNLKQRPILFLNRPSESRSALTRCFADATHRGGSYFEGHHRGRGLAVGDLDNDGRPDLVLVNVHEPVRLLRNIAEPDNNWVGVELHAPNHRDFVGARLTLTVDGRELVRFAKGGGSYLSAHDPRILFGLGQAKQVGPLVIEWPTGEPRKQVIPQIEPGKYHRIDQK